MTKKPWSSGVGEGLGSEQPASRPVPPKHPQFSDDALFVMQAYTKDDAINKRDPMVAPQSPLPDNWIGRWIGPHPEVQGKILGEPPPS